MRGGEHEVARAYVLYREERAQERAKEAREAAPRKASTSIHVTTNGELQPLDLAAHRARARGLRRARRVNAEPIRDARARPLRRRADGGGAQVAVLAARTLIEQDPGLHLRHRAPAAAHAAREALGEEATHADMATRATPNTSRAS